MKFARILCYALLAATLLISAVGAAENVTIDGPVVSIDQESRTFVVKDKKTGKDLTVKVEKASTPLDVYTKGTMDDVKDGTTVKLYGKVREDLSGIDGVSAICVMPMPSTYTNKKSRMDGVLAVNGDAWSVKRGDKTAEVKVRAKPRVEKVFRVDLGFVEKGTHMRFTATAKDDYYVPRWELRANSDRQKAEEYAAAMSKDK